LCSTVYSVATSAVVRGRVILALSSGDREGKDSHTYNTLAQPNPNNNNRVNALRDIRYNISVAIFILHATCNMVPYDSIDSIIALQFHLKEICSRQRFEFKILNDDWIDFVFMQSCQSKHSSPEYSSLELHQRQY
jgi:hypothetical protein